MGDTLHEMGDDLTADSNEEPNQNAVEKFINVIQDGLVGVLYIMGKDMKGSYFIAVLSMFVDCAQLAALATPTIFDTPGDPTYGETNPFLNPLHVLFNAFQFSQLSHLNYIFVPMALILVFLLFFNVMYVGYCWTYQMFNWLFIVRVLRSSATILTGVLYIPILTIFAGTVHCAGLDSSQCAIFRPFVALAALFFIPFSLITTATFFDPRRDGGGPSTMPHARVVTLHQMVNCFGHTGSDVVWFCHREQARHARFLVCTHDNIVFLSGVLLPVVAAILQTSVQQSTNGACDYCVLVFVLFCDQRCLGI